MATSSLQLTQPSSARKCKQRRTVPELHPFFFFFCAKQNASSLFSFGPMKRSWRGEITAELMRTKLIADQIVLAFYLATTVCVGPLHWAKTIKMSCLPVSIWGRLHSFSRSERVGSAFRWRGQTSQPLLQAVTEINLQLRLWRSASL